MQASKQLISPPPPHTNTLCMYYMLAVTQINAFVRLGNSTPRANTH
jgi:hypothetical protein